MTNKMRNLVLSVIMLIFGDGMYVIALDIPKKIESDVGSGYVPKFIAICIAVTAIAQLILTLKNNSESDKKVVKFFDDPFGGIGTIVLMAAYMLAFEPLGFLVASAVYLFLQILLLSDKTNRNPILFAIIAIVLPVAVEALFVFVIKMPLPKGILGF